MFFTPGGLCMGQEVSRFGVCSERLANGVPGGMTAQIPGSFVKVHTCGSLSLARLCIAA
jgi:hypothetical protein